MYLDKITLIIFALNLAIAETTHAQFIVENLTNSAEGRSEQHPQINGSGDAVWSENGEIFFYDGTTITQITSTTFGNQDPEIDELGNIVWRGTLTPGGDSEGSTQEIFLWDGSSIMQLTNNSYSDRLPRISNGKVVWEAMGFGGTDSEIFLFDGSSVTQLTNNSFDDSDPRISGNGDVFWVGEAGAPNAGQEIFRFDGTSITRLTNNAYADRGPRVNDVGQAVWTGDNQIFLFDGVSVSQFTTSLQNSQPDINDAGQISWSGVPNGGMGVPQILFFDGTSTIEVTNDFSTKTQLRINNTGSIVWKKISGAIEEILHFDGTSVTNLSTGFTNNTVNNPDISDNGQVIFLGVPLSDNNYDVFIATPETDQEEAVAIDIKPGSFSSSINPRNKGVIPIAILTTAAFDATTVDSTTLLFGATGREAAPVQAALEDVDGDGDTDMILHFKTQDTGIQCGDTSASLTGETFDGQTIEGTDTIVTVGCK